jgi:diguanylate cyclase (GGDEF)-like protein
MAPADSEIFSGVEATSVGEDLDGSLWISLVTGHVLSGVPVRSEEAVELTRIRVFGRAEGLSPGFAEVIALKGGVRIGTATSVLQPATERLTPDPLFTRVLGQGQGAFRIKDAGDGGYWVASAKRPLRLVRAGTSGDLAMKNTALLRTPSGSRILDFLEVSEKDVWIGTDDGAFRYDPSEENLAASQIKALVRRVQSNLTQLSAGGPADSLEPELPHLAPLRFEVGSSSLDDPSRNRFRFRLDGQDADWSPWTADTRKDYTNLGPGAYRFRVETRDVYGRIGKEAGFSFGVLTPWYRKPWAVALGLAALVGLFLLALYLRTRALRARQRELEAIVYQKTSELREASFTDLLTGLRNRRYFTEVMEAEISLASRPGSPVLHLFLVDLDHFKQVNDTHGHAAGDAVLRQAAGRLQAAMRTSDLIFRWGGEEFLIVARGVPELPRKEIANRIVRIIGEVPFDLGHGRSLAHTASVGFATYPFYPDSPATLPFNAVMELADLSLYRAKQTGRNRAVGVTPRTGPPVPSDLWKDKVLENLEQSTLAVEVLEGPPPKVP